MAACADRDDHVALAKLAEQVTLIVLAEHRPASDQMLEHPRPGPPKGDRLDAGTQISLFVTIASHHRPSGTMIWPPR